MAWSLQLTLRRTFPPLQLKTPSLVDVSTSLYEQPVTLLRRLDDMGKREPYVKCGEGSVRLTTLVLEPRLLHSQARERGGVISGQAKPHERLTCTMADRYILIKCTKY